MNSGASAARTAGLATLERAINGALSLDARTQARLAALAGQVLRIEVTVPALEVFVLPGTEGLRLAGYFETRPDCAVSGAASDFVALLAATDKPSALVNGNLRVSGDSSLLLELQAALAELDLDWEQRLASILGEVPAHQLGRAARSSARFGRDARDTLLRHVEEFIHEEARLAPPRLEVEDFFADLRALANRSERLEATTRRLARRVQARGAKPE
jgi:ubiquinone biosynthesis accessory factor UbiJ